jgi:hypothetical protein
MNTVNLETYDTDFPRSVYAGKNSVERHTINQRHSEVRFCSMKFNSIVINDCRLGRGRWGRATRLGLSRKGTYIVGCECKVLHPYIITRSFIQMEIGEATDSDTFCNPPTSEYLHKKHIVQVYQTDDRFRQTKLAMRSEDLRRLYAETHPTHLDILHVHPTISTGF